MNSPPALRVYAVTWVALMALLVATFEIYSQLGLRLTYQPSDRTVRAEAHINPAQHWQFESVRGGT